MKENRHLGLSWFLGILFVLLGVLSTILGYNKVKNQETFLENARFCSATVVEVIYDIPKYVSISYNVEDSNYHSMYRCSNGTDMVNDGELTIYYNTSNPYEFYTEYDIQTQEEIVIMYIVCGLIFLFGVFLIVVGYLPNVKKNY